MPPLTISEQQLDHLLVLARDVLAESGPITNEAFHEIVLLKAPALAILGPGQIEFVLSTYYDFSSGQVIERDLGSHDRDSVKALK